MRRLLAGLVLVVGLAGCGEKGTGSPDTVARVGDAHLSAEQLAAFLGAGKGVRLNEESADFISNVWVDYTTFARAAASGAKLTDSATIAEAMWPQLTEMKATVWHDTLMGRRLKIDAADVQAAFDKGDNRLFQHILFRVTPGGTPEEKSTARKQAQGALASLKGGASFGALAAKASQDPGSARDSGYLGVGPAGRFVPQFDSAAWALKPGETSGIVETPFGFHIIRRPTLAEASARFENAIGESKAQALDSIYMDSLALQKKLKIRSDAPKAMKDAINDPDKYAKSTKVIADFDGGSMNVQQYLRWVRVLPPQITGQLKAAPDSALTRFATILGTNVLLIKQADSAGIHIPADQWQQLSAAFAAQVDTLESEMGLAAIDSTKPEAERLKEAQAKVDEYFQGIISAKLRMRPVPGALASVLRERTDVAFSEAGTKKALEIARAAQLKDTTAAAMPEAADTTKKSGS